MTSDEGNTKTYSVNEIFYSVQGEGVRAGTPNVFIRFAACNLTCREEEEGFDCDTDFSNGLKMSLGDLLIGVTTVLPEGVEPKQSAIILTGGEPMLQVDSMLCEALKGMGFYLAVETNGTTLPKPPDALQLIDWVCMSPKTAIHTLRLQQEYGTVDEVKVVLPASRALPKFPTGFAANYLVSPVFLSDGHVDGLSLVWCIDQVKKNPRWRLSCQQHKWWGVR